MNVNLLIKAYKFAVDHGVGDRLLALAIVRQLARKETSATRRFVEAIASVI